MRLRTRWPFERPLEPRTRPLSRRRTSSRAPRSTTRWIPRVGRDDHRNGVRGRWAGIGEAAAEERRTALRAAVRASLRPGREALFSYSAGMCEAARAMLAGEADPGLPGRFAEPLSAPDESGGVSIWRNLLSFFAHPTRVYLRDRLGVRAAGSRRRPRSTRRSRSRSTVSNGTGSRSVGLDPDAGGGGSRADGGMCSRAADGSPRPASGASSTSGSGRKRSSSRDSSHHTVRHLTLLPLRWTSRSVDSGWWGRWSRSARTGRWVWWRLGRLRARDRIGDLAAAARGVRGGRRSDASAGDLAGGKRRAELVEVHPVLDSRRCARPARTLAARSVAGPRDAAPLLPGVLACLCVRESRGPEISRAPPRRKPPGPRHESRGSGNDFQPGSGERNGSVPSPDSRRRPSAHRRFRESRGGAPRPPHGRSHGNRHHPCRLTGPRSTCPLAGAGTTFIEASAGTGKTRTLTTLVARLVVEQGWRLDQILIVTFTRAATAELRDRIRRTLGDALAAAKANAAAEPGSQQKAEGDSQAQELIAAWVRADGVKSRRRGPAARSRPVRHRSGGHLHDSRILPAGTRRFSPSRAGFPSASR